jgi:hypothetical protein
MSQTVKEQEGAGNHKMTNLMIRTFQLLFTNEKVWEGRMCSTQRGNNKSIQILGSENMIILNGPYLGNR